MRRGALADVAILAAVWAVVCLPNLGAASLWDVDEGHNAECAREMLVSGNWVVPYFNYNLRTDKPPLLYWLQIASYSAFGVTEFAARLPSALALLGAVLILYTLGRAMFGAESALWAALLLAISPGAAGAAHFANPDALLLLCTTAALAMFWHEMASEGGGSFSAIGACCGLGVLAKGPVGLVLPAAIGLLYIAWAGRWRALLTPRVLLLPLAVVLVAGPWYALVAAETKGLWVKEFLLKHNLERGMAVMEGHGGPYVYYLIVLLPGLLPWSVFLAPAAWDAWNRRADEADGGPMKLLLCWAAVYLVFFSAASTKLPNYILPAYPAAALMLGHWLHRWRTGATTLPRWVECAAVGLIGLAGVAFTAGAWILGGLRGLDGLAAWAWLGLLLLTGGVIALTLLLMDDRRRASWALTLASLAFVALLAGGLMPALNEAKPARHLADALPEGHRAEEVRLAASRWWQPSLVFYTGREVARLDGPADVALFLSQALPAYAAVSEEELEGLQRYPVRVRVLTRRGDLYRGRAVVLVTNR